MPPDDRRMTDEATAGFATDSQSAAWHLPGERYRVVDEIARGGMGVVLRAVDTDVQRTLALKVMLGSPSEAHQQRFLDEARITGQLQHPGIPPVHDIGRMKDGLPFFSMKLIEGHTLGELLRQRKSPQDDLPRLLMIFEQIAQTVAYAHSLGIIHRDLKPANVMVGAFGEVQVMDWGLAKRLSEGQPAAEPGKRDPADAATGQLAETIDPTPSDTDAGSRTQAGQIMGTLAYMPPEQALGEIDQLDQRADVFGLGAILCEILTGQPPYASKDHSQLYKLASEGRLDRCFGRLNASGADEELVSLAKRCLAPQPDDRPRDAGEVSRVVIEHLETVQQRLKQTEIERAEAQTRVVEEQKRREVEQAKTRAERQKRRVTVALAASLLLLVVGAGLAGWWHQSAALEQVARDAELQVRKDNLNREVLAVLQEAEGIREDLHARLLDPRAVPELLSDINQWAGAIDAAKTAWQRADTLAGSDPSLVRSEVTNRLDRLEDRLSADERDYRLAKQLDAIRQNTQLAVGGKFDPQAAAAEYPAVFREAGFDIETNDVEVVVKRIRESPIRHALVAALDHWALYDVTERTVAISRRAEDPDPWLQRLFDVQQRADLEGLKQLIAEIEFARQSPQKIVMLGAIMHAAGLDPAPLLRRALIHYPRDYNLLCKLGMSAKDPQERIGSYRAALAVRPDSTAALCNLSSLLTETGDLDGAIRHCRRGLELDPEFSYLHVNLGHALSLKGDAAEAFACYQTAVKLDPNNAVAHMNLGNSLASRGDPQAALEHFKKSAEVDATYAPAFYSLGTYFWRSGDLDQAVADLQKAVTLDPELADAHCNLGLVLDDQGKFAEALAALRRGHELGSQRPNWSYPSDKWLADVEAHLALDRKLTDVLAGEAEPADDAERLAMADLLARYKKQHHAAAAKFYRDAFEADPKLEDDPRSGHRYNAACAAARAVAEEGDDKLNDSERTAWLEQARMWLQADLDAWKVLREQQSAAAPRISRTLQHWQTDPDLAAVRDEAALAGLSPVEQAAWRKLWADVESLKAPLEAAKDHFATASALRAKRDLQGAVAEYRKAIALDPQFAEAHGNLAQVLDQLGRFDEALVAVRRCHELGMQRKNWPYPSAKWVAQIERHAAESHFKQGRDLRAKEDLEGAVTQFQAAIRIDPQYAEAHCELANVLKLQGEFDEALATVRRGHELGSQRSGWPYPSDAWLAEAEQIVELDRKLPAILRGDEAPADANEHAKTAMLLLYKKQYTDSARFFAEAFRADRELADHLRPGLRYHAARAAARAYAQVGDHKLPDEVRAKWLRQARAWLEADLAALTELFERDRRSAPLIKGKLQNWQAMPDLAAVRDPSALDGLPEAEQAAWRNLWAGVESLLKQLETSTR